MSKNILIIFAVALITVAVTAPAGYFYGLQKGKQQTESADKKEAFPEKPPPSEGPNFE